jgi:flavin reductase ActVB
MAVIDTVDFRNAMARFASGVTVATTVDRAGQPAGFTASAFSSLSLDPPLILVCLDKRANSYAAFRSCEQFAVSILAADQEEIATRFATRDVDKFEGVTVVRGEVTGLPLIPEAVAHLECRVFGRPDGGDHTIIIGEVLRAASTDHEPLLHFNRRFGRFHAPEEEVQA